jgi:hypothetical protein
MKKTLRMCHLWILLPLFWLVIARPIQAQEPSEQKKDLIKEMTDLIEIYGIEKPAKVTAIYFRHLMEGKKQDAYELIQTQDPVKRFIDKSADLKYLTANAADIPSMDLIGFRMLSTTVVTFLYVLTTRDGPVAVRVDAFSFNKKFYISDIRIARQRDEIMKMADGVRLLPASMELKFNSK